MATALMEFIDPAAVVLGAEAGDSEAVIRLLPGFMGNAESLAE